MGNKNTKKIKPKQIRNKEIKMNVDKNDNENNNFSENKQKKGNKLNIYLKSDLVKGSYAWRQLTNTFTIFKSINNLLFLIYATKIKSIICYDINKEKKISEIKNAHKDYCFSLRHYLDTINKRDIIISIFDINILKL